MSLKKKVFPKIKKKLKGFLTDESGKITKKDALGLAAGAALLSGAEEVAAGHFSHSNSRNGHSSGSGGTCYTPAQEYSQHASGVINGHYSSNVTGDTPQQSCFGGTAHGNHGSHASHGSHGSHGSRW